MAGKKRATSRKTVAKRKAVYSRPSKSSLSLADYFRFGESYTSLVLGIVVVIIVTILLVAFVRQRASLTQDTSSTSTQERTTDQTAQGERTYTVKPGDDLWKIAQEQYKDGFKWTQIAQANNITNPGVIHVGTELTLPAVSEEVASETVAQNEEPVAEPTQPQTTAQTAPETPGKITDNSYTVVRGDDLWNIAVRAYGDGYRWVDIARANKLSNPDIIHSENKLVIPR